MASEHAGGTIVVNCDLLNVRRGAGTGWGVLGTLKRNDTKKVVDSKKEQNSTNLWYRIDYEGKEGWVVGTYVKFTPAICISSRPAVAQTSSRPGSSSQAGTETDSSHRPTRHTTPGSGRR